MKKFMVIGAIGFMVLLGGHTAYVESNEQIVEAYCEYNDMTLVSYEGYEDGRYHYVATRNSDGHRIGGEVVDWYAEQVANY